MEVKANPACEIDFAFCLLHCGACKVGKRPARGLQGWGWGVEKDTPPGMACLQMAGVHFHCWQDNENALL